MKIRYLLPVVAFCLSPLSVFAIKGRPIALQFEFSRGGNTVCKAKKEIQDGETFLLCEGISHGNRALVKVKTKIFPYSKAEKDKGFKDQVEVSATVEEVETSGRIALVSNQEIIALDGEQAEMSVTNSGPEEALRMTVTTEILHAQH